MSASADPKPIAPKFAVVHTVRCIPCDEANRAKRIPRADIYRQRDVASILSTDTKTVRALCEAGLLHGYLLPHGRAWLIPHDCLVAFAAEHNLTLDGLEPEPARK
jgi:hypothetical protein